MESLVKSLDELNGKISDLEGRIKQATEEAENNIKPLNEELARLRQEKKDFASKNDFESVQDCRRRENNLKFKISAQWNRSSILKDELSQLKRQRRELEDEIRLEKDRIKRNEEILARMDTVLENYKKTQNLESAAVESKIQPGSVRQWFEWGKNGYNSTYSYFYEKIIEIDDYFRDLEVQKLKNQMDSVAEAFSKTGSLESASEIAGVSYDTVQYWYEWGLRGFGAENTYFYKKIDKEMKNSSVNDSHCF